MLMKVCSSHRECVRCAPPRRLTTSTEQMVVEALRRGEQLRAEEDKRREKETT
jgi:hypothetical protein